MLLEKIKSNKKRRRLKWLKRSSIGKPRLKATNKKKTSFKTKSWTLKDKINYLNWLLVDYKMSWK